MSYKTPTKQKGAIQRRRPLELLKCWRITLTKDRAIQPSRMNRSPWSKRTMVRGELHFDRIVSVDQRSRRQRSKWLECRDRRRAGAAASEDSARALNAAYGPQGRGRPSCHGGLLPRYLPALTPSISRQTKTHLLSSRCLATLWLVLWISVARYVAVPALVKKPNPC